MAKSQSIWNVENEDQLLEATLAFTLPAKVRASSATSKSKTVAGKVSEDQEQETPAIPNRNSEIHSTPVNTPKLAKANNDSASLSDSLTEELLNKTMSIQMEHTSPTTSKPDCNGPVPIPVNSKITPPPRTLVLDLRHIHQAVHHLEIETNSSAKLQQ